MEEEIFRPFTEVKVAILHYKYSITSKIIQNAT